MECTVNSSITLFGIKETSVADGRNGYYVNSKFLYECIFGYKRLDTRGIRCTADGSWSSSPNCTKIGNLADVLFESVSHCQGFLPFILSFLIYFKHPNTRCFTV